MSEKVRKLKEEADRLIARGKFDEACACQEQLVRVDPRDLAARQKVAELYGRLGRTADAVRAYQSVAGSYAADGLLLKAIAVCKMILQLDPAHTETQSVLASLTSRRSSSIPGTPKVVVEMPRSMSVAVAPAAGTKSAKEIRGAVAHHVRGFGLTDAPAPRTPASSASPLDGVSNASALEIARVAVELREGPPPIPVEELDAEEHLLEAVRVGDELGDDLDDAPVVVGTPLAPRMLAAIDAATPSFDELMQMTADIGSALGDAPALPAPGAAHAAVDAHLAGELGAHIDLGYQVVTAPLSGPAPATADVAFYDGDDDHDVLDLVDAEVEMARVDVTKVAPIPLFSDLPRDAFLALTERMALRVAYQGEVLIAEGEPGTSMFVIIQGRVKVTRQDGAGAAGRTHELAELLDGAFFGEGALLSDAPRTASVVCVEETMLFEISRELVAQMTADYPSVGDVMRRFNKNRLITNLLKISVIFAPFSIEQKRTLIERFKSRQVEPGTTLVTREKPGDGLYVVLTGRCEVVDTRPDGQEVVVAELKDGDVFGEMSMLSNKDTCASVRAVTPSVVLRLPRQSFAEVIRTHPQILDSLAALSEARQRTKLGQRAALPPDERL
ncbi:MAG: cyclic nucleotide-binding domain-containing protein [Deltaproteobacteria bacterium]|nr:cyclic nucleotide-binding domain-containing protein [Deltaproteobacteria bacterium]